MKSNLTTGLNESLSYKNEVKAITSVQIGSNYGFVLEIESPFGKFYCPMVGYKTKEQAYQVLKGRLK